MAAENHYVYTGEGQPPEEATHVRIHKSITVISRQLFYEHPNIVELICHDGVIKIEEEAFDSCPSLERLVIPGVVEVEDGAFYCCEAIEHVECDKVEIIGIMAFYECKSLKSIDLPSARIVENGAFAHCISLMDIKFSRKLESIGMQAFCDNTNLKRITIPMKSGLFADDVAFVGCENFGQAYLLDEDKAIIQKTADALLLDEWKKDVNKELDSINQTLPNADAGALEDDGLVVKYAGEKPRTIREWIDRVLRKIIHYKVEHYRILSLAAAALAHASPNEIVIDNALSFLQLPDHVFEGERDSSATTPGLDRQLWENIVQIDQRRVEMEMENVAQLKQKISDQDKEIVALKVLNDEKEDEIHQLKLRVAQLEQNIVIESGGVIMKNDADRLGKKRPRGS